MCPYTSTTKEAQSISELIKKAERSPGWNFRSDLPVAVEVEGGCVLHVIPAWLWRPRLRPVPSPRFESKVSQRFARCGNYFSP